MPIRELRRRHGVARSTIKDIATGSTSVTPPCEHELSGPVNWTRVVTAPPFP